jgi:hypothetical protein
MTLGNRSVVTRGSYCFLSYARSRFDPTCRSDVSNHLFTGRFIVRRMSHFQITLINTSGGRSQHIRISAVAQYEQLIARSACASWDMLYHCALNRPHLMAMLPPAIESVTSGARAKSARIK